MNRNGIHEQQMNDLYAMDTIKAELTTTKGIPDPHLAMIINGKSLDKMIAAAFHAHKSRLKDQQPAIRGFFQRIKGFLFPKSTWEFDYEGSIPTLLDVFYDEIPDNAKAKQVVWERINTVGETPVIAPLLMCPDDLDFYCFVVVAEIRCVGDTVRWERIGLDDLENRGIQPETLGEKVLWFDYIPPLVFPKEEYFECIETFRKALLNAPTQQTEN